VCREFLKKVPLIDAILDLLQNNQCSHNFIFLAANDSGQRPRILHILLPCPSSFSLNPAMAGHKNYFARGLTYDIIITRMRKNNIKKTILFTLSYSAGLMFIALTVYFFAKDFVKSRQIDNEIQLLQSEIYKTGDKNLKLTELIKYFDSEAYAEQKARTELGLIKPGESVVIVPKILGSEFTDTSTSESNEEVSNIVKWWRYFFPDRKQESN